MALLAAPVYSTFAYCFFGGSVFLGMGVWYRVNQYTQELERWNSAFAIHQLIRQQIPKMSLVEILTKDVVNRCYLAREEGEHLWINQVKQASFTIAAHENALNKVKAGLLKDLIEKRLLDDAVIRYFHYRRFLPNQLDQFLKTQAVQHSQLNQNYVRLKAEHEAEQKIHNELLLANRQLNRDSHNQAKENMRLTRNVVEAMDPEPSTWISFWRNTLTDVTTDAIDASKQEEDSRLLQKATVRQERSKQEFREKLVTLYPMYRDLFSQAEKALSSD